MTEYYPQKKKKADGTEYIYYQKECKECTKKRTRKWAIENPEIVTASNRKMNDKRREFLKQYKRDNREQYSKNLKKWQKDNPEKLKEYNQNHRNHNINSKEWAACRRYFNNCCAYCGIHEEEAKTLQGQYLHKEHVVHNGENDLSNCVPSCRSCNSSKRQYKLDDWYNEDNRNYTYERLEKIIKWITNEYLNYIHNK